jgi:hypothetical protein
VCTNALQQHLLVCVGQKCLERVARQKDQPELLPEVEGTGIAFHPAHGQVGGFAARQL